MKKLFTLIFGLLIISIYAYGTPDYFADNKKVAPDPIFNNTIIIPKNKILSVEIKEIPTNYAPSEKFSGVLKNDFTYNNKIIAPENSIVSGVVTKIYKDKKTSEDKIMVKFTNIYTPNAQNIPISAVFNTTDGSIDTNKIFAENNEIRVVQPITYIYKN